MKNSHEDRRIRITKLAIRESFIELLQTHPIQKITVKMICTAADINRSTFYAHYDNQYDLLDQIEKEVIADIKEHVFSIRFLKDSERVVPVIVQVLEYARQNTGLFKVLLSVNGSPSFHNELIYIAQEKMIEEIREDIRLDTRTSKYVELFCISAVKSILYQWLDEGCVDQPIQLAELISRLLMEGVRGLYEK